MGKYPTKCPQCGGRHLWLVESTGYYWQWVQCDDCQWRSQMESIPEAERAESDNRIRESG